MVNNPMADAIENVNVNNVYECIKEAEPPELGFKDFDLGKPAVYNYDNIIEKQIDLNDVLLLNLFKTINSMNDKLVNGRIKDKDAEKIRIDYLKTYINACNCFISMANKLKVNTIYDKDVLSNFMNSNIIENPE